MSAPAPAAMNSTSSSPDGGARVVAPALARRMAAFLCEGVLCFGIVVSVAGIYYVLAHQDSGIEKRSGLLASCFVALGCYFTYLWTRGGQTLAQKTWHLRVVTSTGAPLAPRRALARYFAAWVWLLPPLALASLLDVRSPGFDFSLLIVWILAYAFSALLHPRRQFWHDALCGTAIVTSRPLAPLPQ